MDPRAMTRRTLLAASAGAVAGATVSHGSALGALSVAPPRLRELWIGRLSPSGRTIALGRPADLVGVQWSGPATAGVKLRYRLAGGGWSRWASAAGHGHGPEGPSGPPVGDPVWTGGARMLQLAAGVPLQGVRLHLVDVSDGVGARRQARSGAGALAAAALPLAGPPLAAGPGQPAIIARRAWARGVSHPRVAPEYGAVRLAFVHHTENPNGYSPAEVPAMLRAIYAFHRFVNGWNDIGYNFVVDLYGRIFEARAGGIQEPVVGAHAGGYNLVSTGVAVLGSFMSTPISTPARRSLERLLAWKLALHGVPAAGRLTVRVNPAGASYSRFPANASVSLPHIAGHRDADSTDCPGNVLYGELPSIRRAVGVLAPRPVRATLALVAPAPASPPAEGTPAPAEGTPAPAPVLQAGLSLLDGTPLAGVPLALQARSVSRRGEVVRESTVAEGLTDAQGRWQPPAALPVQPPGQWVRAIFSGASGYGAAVSEAVVVTSPVITPTPAPAPTPPAVAPPAG